MTQDTPQRKLICFSDNSPEMNKVQEELNEGWIITSLIQNNRQYVGIMEKHDSVESELAILRFPSKKKFKLQASS